ncbi:MarR family transcriptional regulator [Pseudonocardia sp. RS11V-5]|uniref:MarR family winged helix-turn-helix transcriptional regulator n=1 Tax=Pseudonocardia terrae TaxID=2905831 RepID=UPI001E53664F|nr:MarR family transcriptional regulator [Pseudonocardia terrae]MCE3551501.1 MarR family transcriptional regulator [Pseudonocardia terrae]
MSAPAGPRRGGRADIDREALAAAMELSRRTRLATTAVNRALAPHGLSFTRFGILLLLSMAEPGSYSMSRLAGSVLLHPGGVTNAISRLEREGLVHRVPAATEDRRVVIVTITDEGRRRVDAARGTVFAEVGLGAGPEDLDELFELVQMLRDAEHDEGP